jgi:hypothetical protein
MPDDLAQPTLGPHGGKRIKGQRRDAGTLVHSRGNSVAYVIARLRREGLHERVEAIHARQVSAFATAVELGWRTRPRLVYSGNFDQAQRPTVIDVKSLIA